MSIHVSSLKLLYGFNETHWGGDDKSCYRNLILFISVQVVLFQVVSPYSNVVGTNILEHHAASIFRASQHRRP